MIASLARTALDLLYPRQCQVCGDSLHCRAFPFLCDVCFGAVVRLPGPCCEVCGLPFHGDMFHKASCPNCTEMDLHFDRARALLRFHGVARQAIHGLKYLRQLHWSRVLQAWQADGVGAVVDRAEVDVVMPVPLHPVRERERGFNQAWVLVEPLAHMWRIASHRRALVRVRQTETQTHLNRAERMSNLRGAFEVRRPEVIAGRRVLLVDDVLTTGSTTSECARVLREAGATSVLVFTLARG